MYSKLPNELFYKTDDKSIIKLISDDKVVLVLDYLYLHTNRMNKCKFPLSDMIEFYGYKINQRKGKINDKFKDILFKLQGLKLLKINIPIAEIKTNNIIEVRCNIDYSSNYIMLRKKEKDLILNYKEHNIDNLILLKMYCYLKARMYKREDNRDIVITGGKAEACYPNYETIYDDIGISDVKKYIDILRDLNLIVYANLGLCYKGNRVNMRDSSNIYVLKDKNGRWEYEMKEAKKFYKQMMEGLGYTFKGSREYKNNNHRLNGELGGLMRLKNQGLATQEHLKRIEEINLINN